MLAIRFANECDTTAIRRVMDKALDTVKPGDFIADDIAFIKRHVNGAQGFGMVVTDSTVVVAYLLVRFPGDATDNLGRDIALPDESLSHVVHMESVAVTPAWQGKGIQRCLVYYGESAAIDLGARWSLCTVAPNNSHSLANFTALGYRVVKHAVKYSGHGRLIMVKSLTSEDHSLIHKDNFIISNSNLAVPDLATFNDLGKLRRRVR